MKTTKRIWINEPSVLILHEKHGCRYYEVQNEKQLFSAALTILRARVKDGYWYNKPSPPKELSFSREDVEKMPEALRKEPMRQLAAYKLTFDFFKEEQLTWNNIQKAIAGDSELAWKVLYARSDYEYERVELKAFVKIKP